MKAIKAGGWYENESVTGRNNYGGPSTSTKVMSLEDRIELLEYRIKHNKAEFLVKALIDLLIKKIKKDHCYE